MTNDYYEWAKVTGDIWNWAHVQPYFKKTEHMKILKNCEFMQHHGTNGEIEVSGIFHYYLQLTTLWHIIRETVPKSVVTQTATMPHKEATLRQLLNKIAAEQNYEKPEISIHKLSSGGANYTSVLFTIIIKEDNKDELHLFAKVAILGEKVRKGAPVIIFDVERYAYTKLAKFYTALEEENRVPEEQRLHFTKCYGFNHRKYQETVVLENLLAQGYGPNDRFNSYDWAYASAAVTEMAKMHALSFAFSKRNPEEFQKTLKIITVNWKEGSMDETVRSTMDIAVRNVRPEYKEALEKYLAQERFQKDFRVNFCAPVRANVIIHADYRGSNLLHRLREVS
ncbi:hypothetical protein PYW07_005512 [Mythimna separata]|uniref:CHK kinase-like domain-containing protein n=1 Tax=Mythimna separata TaxID=271217 RepID=A0AAD7YIE0_MYTSE|nr:hypothetical protein PYW07_005512 [Mythimna separata]